LASMSAVEPPISVMTVALMAKNPDDQRATTWRRSFRIGGYFKKCRWPLIDVRYGSLADIKAPRPDVRFTPDSRRRLSAAGCPLGAKGGHMRSSKTIAPKIFRATIAVENTSVRVPPGTIEMT